MVTRPGINWVGAHPGNFERGRAGIKLEAVVWHVTEGGMPGPWFNDPRARASTNFAVSKSGRIEAYVALGDTAYAHGSVEVAYEDARPLIRDNWGVNPNLWAASIEFEGTRDDVIHRRVPAPEQEAAAIRLTAWLFHDVLFRSGAGGVAVDREHILMHRDISPRSRSCPVWGEDVQERMIGRIQSLFTERPRGETPAIGPTRIRILEDALTVQALDLEHRADQLTTHAIALRIQAANLRGLLPTG
ncbi:MAG: N-acetylmuramoyl-L-alanine amidase [Dehalococcoidia bacterium]